MRLLKIEGPGKLSLTKDLTDDIPAYAILSHTWGADEDEVTFSDLGAETYKSKAGYIKLRFCEIQARKDGIEYLWVDTCCIDKTNHVELSEAITSMFRWYRNAVKCYVYLSDVSARKRDNSGQAQWTWESAFRKSRWYTRGWTLQELLASTSVEFFSREETLLGSKLTLKKLIHEITDIPIAALQGAPLSTFSVQERLRWTATRNTKKKEDGAYCLLGIFDVFMPLMYGEGDNAIARLKEEIRKRAEPSAPETHVHWMVARPTNPLFTGRRDTLRELETTVREAVDNSSSQNQCRIVISGIGGQGKSEICVQLASSLRQMFWGVFWIDVSTTDLAEKSFLEIAHKISVPAQTWEDARLGIANLKHPWLLVLDNADSLDVDYQHYFPDGKLGIVMLTSRNEECNQYATKSIVLDGLAEAEARELLLRAARIPHDLQPRLKDDADTAARLLQSHALAIVQAGSYISRGHCTLAEYPMVFAQQRQRLLKFRPSQAKSRYGDVYATFEASATILQSSSMEAAGDALQLLPLLATCGPSRFPLPLFEAGWKCAHRISSPRMSDDDRLCLTPWHVSHLPPLMQAHSETWDSFRLVEAVNLLKALSLVSTDTHSGFLSVSMHPLTHVWARDRQTVAQQHESWVTTGCLVAISGNDGFWLHHRWQLQPHLQALMLWDINTMFGSGSAIEITSVLVYCGWLLHRARDDAKLFILIQNIFARLSLDWQIVNEEWLAVYQLTTRSLKKNGKFKEWLSLQKQITAIQIHNLAEDHPDRTDWQFQLAKAYRANGQLKEAISLLEQVVMVEEQKLAEDHPHRLTSQHELARTYRANGRVDEAVLLLEQVLKIEEQRLAEDHPDRLTSQCELAKAYRANGRVDEAVLLLEQALKIREQKLEKDHPERLEAQHNLATCYWDLGRHSEAHQLMNGVVRIWGHVLNADHPYRIKSEHWLRLIEKEMRLIETK